MTFAGQPRNQHRYDHAHESPGSMTVPLVVLAVFAIVIGLADLRGDRPARAGPAGRDAGDTPSGGLGSRGLTMPANICSHEPADQGARDADRLFHRAGRLAAGDGHLLLATAGPERDPPAVPAESTVSSGTSGGSTSCTTRCSSARCIGRPGGSPASISESSTGIIHGLARGASRLSRLAGHGRRPQARRRVWSTRLARRTWNLGLSLRARSDRPPAAVRDVHRGRHGRALFVLICVR